MESFEYDPTAAQSNVASYDAAVATVTRAYAADLRPQDEHALISAPFDPKLAFQHFAGAVYPVPSPVAGPVAVARSSFETPEDRLSRLKRDVAAFKAELDALTQRHQAAAAAAAAAGAAPAAGPQGSPLAVALLIQTELDELASDLGAASLAEAAVSASALPAHSASAASLSQGLASLRVAAAAAAPAPTQAVTGAPAPVPSSSSSASPPLALVDLSAADRRLAALERVVGSSHAADLAFPDLCTGLASLSRQLELLDMGRVERIVRRVRSLSAELDLLLAKQQQQATAAVVAGTAGGAGAAAGAAGATSGATASFSSSSSSSSSLAASPVSADQLNAMHSLLQRWDSIAASVPAVVARLQSLKGVHEGAALAVARVAALSAQHKNAQEALEESRGAMATLTAAVEENAQTMGRNVETLQARMAALTDKVDKLLTTRK
jgi:hypothetical protein